MSLAVCVCVCTVVFGFRGGTIQLARLGQQNKKVPHCHHHYTAYFLCVVWVHYACVAR